MNIEKSETFIVGTFLAIVGGFLDSYTYICRGEIFANAQTGNMIFLVLNATSGNFYKAFLYLMPIAAFSFGVLVSEFMKNKFDNAQNFHWKQISLLIEIAVLVVASFVINDALDVFVNISIAFVCGIQVQSFRKLYSNAYATTMCTGNLRSATECFYYGFAKNDRQMKRNSLQYFAIILIFLAGVLLGAFATTLMLEKSILIAAMLLVFPLIYIKKTAN